MLEAAETLEDLLAATAGGDRRAFRALYDRTSAKLFGICLRICRDRMLAEDALQELYVDLWRRAGQFDPGRGQARFWLAAMARNRAIDRLRRAGGPGGKGFVDDEAALETAPDGRMVEDGGTEFMALLTCLGRLDQETQDMVLLAYYEGWQRDELAARFDRPVNTVKTQLRRALAALRDCLEE